MERRADFLRFIAVRLHRPELRQLIRQPGVNAVYRVTVHYHDGQHPNQIATLIRAQDDTVTLEVAYLRRQGQPVLRYVLDPDRFRAFDLALRTLGFDRLDDQAGLPSSLTADLWLVERTSGSYSHDVVLAPDSATGSHAALVLAVRTHLREAVRAIQPD